MTVFVPSPAAPHSSAYAPGKLQPHIHSRLVEELERFAFEAGVNPADITGATYNLTADEIAYLKDFRTHGKTGRLGLIYVGQHSPSVMLRGRSIVGALLRNFITARFITREELVTRLFDRGGAVREDCVVVPDFHYHDAPAATKRALASFVMGRAARGLQTVMGVPSKKVLADVFGDEVELYLNHYTVLHGVVSHPN